MPTQARYEIADRVATVTLDRPERKNPLTFELYAELRDWFGGLTERPRRSKPSYLTGAGGTFLLRRRRARNHRSADGSVAAAACSSSRR